MAAKEKVTGASCPRIGAHVSAAQGLFRAVENAQRIGAECFQIFGSSPRQWKVRLPSEDSVAAYRRSYEISDLGPVVLHAAYLANLASPIPQVRIQSTESLAGHLAIAEKIGALGLVFHVGSGKGVPEEKAYGWVATGMQEVLKKVSGTSLLIMENTAGGGHRLGGLDDMRAILERAGGDKRIGVCIDTAHAFESGLLRYTKKDIRRYFDELERSIGLDRLTAIHANDSKTPFDSHLDRHENVGEGHIGLRGFRNLAKERRLHAVPWFIETPGFDQLGPDKKNIDALRSCFI